MFTSLNQPSRLTIAVLVALGLAASALPAGAGEPMVSEQRTPSAIVWTTSFDYASATITVSGAPGVAAWQGPADGPLVLEVTALAAWAAAHGLPLDGAYSYEVSFAPALDPELRSTLDALRPEEGGIEGVPPLPVTSGHLQIAGGVIVGAGDGAEEPTTRDQVVPDDMIVQSSLCVGFDCVNGEVFSFDTVRLKENNLRIRFMDTSAGSFPTGDWEITANDSINGGASYLAFTDIDSGGRKVFVVEGGAPAHSLYVEDNGRVGMGTSTPVVELHLKDSDTPTVRLEQDNSGGWGAQTWDLAGNESNFFIRDATNGSKIPFRIQPGTPSSTLSLKADGKVGIGTWSPAAPLEVETTGADSSLLLERTDGLGWFISSTGGRTLTIATGTEPGDVLLILDEAGNLTTSGTVNNVSDRNAKRDFVPVSGTTVLDAVARLPISEWSLRSDTASSRHLGPMAQDFHAAFGLGSDERHIAPSDVGGVALAAVQGLLEELEERDRRIDDLTQRIQELEELVAGLR